VEVHRFPGYAPGLNPDEFVWTQAKRELSNIDHDGLVTLTLHVVRFFSASADPKLCSARVSTRPGSRGVTVRTGIVLRRLDRYRRVRARP
jgi:hypothetical protein